MSKKNLEWTAEWAYNPKLGQVVKVILESMNYFAPTKVGEKPPLVDKTVMRTKANILFDREVFDDTGLIFT